LTHHRTAARLLRQLHTRLIARPVAGTVELDALTHSNLTVGGVYEMRIYQAERMTSGSSFKAELNFQLGVACPDQCNEDLGQQKKGC